MLKKLKKQTKKIPKKIMVLTMIFAMLFGYFVSIANVIALSYGDGENFIKIGIVNELGFNIDSVTVNGNEKTSDDDEFHSTNDEYHIEITVSGNETTGDKIPAIEYGGNWNDYITPSTHHNENNHTFILDLNDSEHQSTLMLTLKEQINNPQQGNQQQGNQQQGEQHASETNFDGKAYVVWSCGNGVCYHYIDNIPNFDDGNSTFYKDTDIKADNNNSITFDVKAKYKGWYTKESFENWVSDYKLALGHDVEWTTLDPEIILGEPEQNVGQYEAGAIASGCEKPAEDAHWSVWESFESCVNHYAATQGKIWTRQLQPLGEPNYENAYVSYGDRHFKVVIYNSEYKGVAMGNLSELNYYPESWTNPFVKRDQFDISGTTKEKPAMMDSILLEETVMIKPLNYNSFEIAKMEALDVPSDAVEITKVNNEFKLVFSSNFYDNVVFKVTDTKGEISYLKIKRATIDGWIANKENGSDLIADFYFDREKSYSDFVLTAKVILNDGTIKNVSLNAKDGIDDGLGNITPGYEVDEQFRGGKGLKKSTFICDLGEIQERDVDRIYLNAEYKGSTSTKYAGAYVGSGEGTLANIYKEEEN